jgi:predicted HicB family RNase H-like nuclease
MVGKFSAGIHRGYEGGVDWDDEARVYFGRVFGIRDVVTFQGETIVEAKQAFRDSVDAYLALCKSRGEAPDAAGGRPRDGGEHGRR